eukprot:754740-Alexandrium_andersonii.AAC.1
MRRGVRGATASHCEAVRANQPTAQQQCCSQLQQQSYTLYTVYTNTRAGNEHRSTTPNIETRTLRTCRVA